MRFKYRAILDFRSYVREDVFTKRPQLRPNLTVVLDFLRELKERILRNHSVSSFLRHYIYDLAVQMVIEFPG